MRPPWHYKLRRRAGRTTSCRVGRQKSPRRTWTAWLVVMHSARRLLLPWAANGGDVDRRLVVGIVVLAGLVGAGAGHDRAGRSVRARRRPRPPPRPGRRATARPNGPGSTAASPRCGAPWRAEDGDAGRLPRLRRGRVPAAGPRPRRRVRPARIGASSASTATSTPSAATCGAASTCRSGRSCRSTRASPPGIRRATSADDLFSTRIAFVVLLNFPRSTLTERLRDGQQWSRRQWAETRLTGRFALRVPAAAQARLADARAAAEAYINGYNLRAHHLLTADGRRLFRPKLRLLSHWNLRDELKARLRRRRRARSPARPRRGDGRHRPADDPGRGDRQPGARLDAGDRRGRRVAGQGRRAAGRRRHHRQHDARGRRALRALEGATSTPSARSIAPTPGLPHLHRSQVRHRARDPGGRGRAPAARRPRGAGRRPASPRGSARG